jgi:hypothetical protein
MNTPNGFDGGAQKLSQKSPYGPHAVIPEYADSRNALKLILRRGRNLESNAATAMMATDATAKVALGIEGSMRSAIIDARMNSEEIIDPKCLRRVCAELSMPSKFL